ncbi:hypothetical protein Poli38472_001085 [Pythium oligandrum]|uniref:UDP-N-acetylglucosamine transferase subunit ALG14 n=1 Tax=Pythium oligandrum TaxID=41045 RepID=A0A8K1CTF5_PYTOL|nr:hypothetical protein Poli38472_001085 [Pythium oligandrum]|eukprot:TMW68929.1 hypothetical protein Poli38472_001085 [Pythium oligandrum]
MTSTLVTTGVALVLTALLVLLRIWLVIVPQRIKVSQKAYATVHDKKQPTTKHTVMTMVVLGSGGHTTEILKLMKKMKRDVYTPIVFVVAETDKTSREKTMIDFKPSAQDSFVIIPRSREVGQSWSSTVWTTLRSFLVCLSEVYHHRPELVLCNGPGTCIPICAAVLLFRFLGLQRQSKIVFCESFARVQTLSLSGKLLYYVADEFVIHWPQLQAAYPKTTHLGVIC